MVCQGHVGKITWLHVAFAPQTVTWQLWISPFGALQLLYMWQMWLGYIEGEAFFIGGVYLGFLEKMFKGSKCKGSDNICQDHKQ